jgi:hypothetical protein
MAVVKAMVIKSTGSINHISCKIFRTLVFRTGGTLFLYCGLPLVEWIQLIEIYLNSGQDLKTLVKVCCMKPLHFHTCFSMNWYMKQDLKNCKNK